MKMGRKNEGISQEKKNMNKKKREDQFRCVQCGSPIQTLYIQYSPGNIRLIKCENCKAVADEYIECEIMILIIDLILHKPKAYRHLFLNMFSADTFDFEGLLWKLTLAYITFDAYRVMVLTTSENGQTSPGAFGLSAWMFGKVLIDVFFGNLAFLCALLIGARRFFRTSMGLVGYKDLMLAMLVSSYFKFFLVAMMVWQFPSSVVFIVEIFVLSSNTVALKVITDSTIVRCAGVVLFANVVKFLTQPWFVQLHLQPAKVHSSTGRPIMDLLPILLKTHADWTAGFRIIIRAMYCALYCCTPKMNVIKTQTWRMAMESCVLRL